MSWKKAFLSHLDEAGIFIKSAEISPAIELWQLDDKHWHRFAKLAAEHKCRWAAGWAEQVEDQFYVQACFE